MKTIKTLGKVCKMDDNPYDWEEEGRSGALWGAILILVLASILLWLVGAWLFHFIWSLL